MRYNRIKHRFHCQQFCLTFACKQSLNERRIYLAKGGEEGKGEKEGKGGGKGGNDQKRRDARVRSAKKQRKQCAGPAGNVASEIHTRHATLKEDIKAKGKQHHKNV